MRLWFIQFKKNYFKINVQTKFGQNENVVQNK